MNKGLFGINFKVCHWEQGQALSVGRKKLTQQRLVMMILQKDSPCLHNQFANFCKLCFDNEVLEEWGVGGGEYFFSSIAWAGDLGYCTTV